MGHGVGLVGRGFQPRQLIQPNMPGLQPLRYVFALFGWRVELRAQKPLGHRVELIQVASMHEGMARQSPLLRIRRNVVKLILKILSVANAVFVESCLPDFPAKLSAQAVRKATLDALGATLNGLIRRRSQQSMQVFRHD